MIAILGALIGCGAIIAVIVAFVFVLSSAKGESDAITGQIAAGNVSDLADLHPAMLAQISTTLLGASHYFRPMGGKRTEKLAGRSPAPHTMGSLLAVSSEVTRSAHLGTVTVATRNARVDLMLHGPVWRVMMNGAPFGTYESAGGRLCDVSGVPVGWYQRDGSMPGRLGLRGADVALVDPTARLEEHRPAMLRPLFQLAAQPDAEACVWLLAIVGLELGFYAMPAVDRGMMGGGVP